MDFDKNGNKAEVRKAVIEAPNVESRIDDGYLVTGWHLDGNKAVLQPSEFAYLGRLGGILSIRKA